MSEPLHCNRECVVEILIDISAAVALVIGWGYAMFMLATR